MHERNNDKENKPITENGHNKMETSFEHIPDAELADKKAGADKSDERILSQLKSAPDSPQKESGPLKSSERETSEFVSRSSNHDQPTKDRGAEKEWRQWEEDWRVLSSEYETELGDMSLEEFQALEKEELNDFLKDKKVPLAKRAKFRLLFSRAKKK